MGEDKLVDDADLKRLYGIVDSTHSIFQMLMPFQSELHAYLDNRSSISA
jgi:hypothetical protein